MKHFVPLSKAWWKEEENRREETAFEKKTKNSLFDKYGNRLKRLRERRKMCIERKAKSGSREEFKFKIFIETHFFLLVVDWVGCAERLGLSTAESATKKKRTEMARPKSLRAHRPIVKRERKVLWMGIDFEACGSRDLWIKVTHAFNRMFSLFMVKLGQSRVNDQFCFFVFDNLSAARKQKIEKETFGSILNWFAYMMYCHWTSCYGQRPLHETLSKNFH